MDPETEKHFAALIMEEAARLRMQAEKEGVHAYLTKPKVRGKPNPQFLKATVRSIEQANRAAEVSGMWKRRARELELEEREKKKSRYRHKSDSVSRYQERPSHSYDCQSKSTSSKPLIGYKESSPSPRSHNNATDRMLNDCRGEMLQYEVEDHAQEFEDELEDRGLKEEEIEQFLQSRVKRGRGAVGSRMDDTGPYPSPQWGLKDELNVRVKEEWEQRIIGPSREVYESQLGLESKSRKNKKKLIEAEDCTEGMLKCQLNRKEKKRKKKHRHSHKKSKKNDDV